MSGSEHDPEEPLLSLADLPQTGSDPDAYEDWEELADEVATNDEWVYKQADRMVGRLRKYPGKDRRTEGEVFDHQTLMVLHRFLAHGVLRSLDFPVSTGKEANVFRGTTPEGGYAAVKIFRVNTATFKHVLQYIQGDERFQGVGGDKRALVHAWCTKEYRNMLRMREAGCQVPEPYRHLQNVLVMEYLGKREGPWPRLKDVGRLEDPERHFDLLWQDYRRMYLDARLVHADLSEFNILVEDVDQDPDRWTPRIIDVGQAVLRNHPMSEEFLQRDLRNLCAYFSRQGHRVDPMVLRRELLEARREEEEE